MSSISSTVADPDGGAGSLIRAATVDDVPAIRAIYAHDVVNGTGTFEENPPDVAEMGRRWERIVGGGFPFIVAASDGRVHGYAYAARFRERDAYRFTVEDSIYIHPESVGRGFGRVLLSTLIAQCEDRGFRQMVAVIGDSRNARSIRLHTSLGFRDSGSLRAAGFKFGRWLDVMFMQRTLGRGSEPPTPRLR